MVRLSADGAGARQRLPLYAYFCDFYETLADVKPTLLRAGAGAPAGAQPGGSAWAESESPARRAHERLLEQLRAQRSAVEHDGSPDECALYRDAQYAMAALADEQILLEVRWNGRAEWLGLTLEGALFDTRAAGVGFYRIVDQLLATQAPTLLHAELGLVLLAALELGFRGGLRGDREADRLARRRLELAAFVRGVRGTHDTGRAFEQAYEHTVRLADPESNGSRLAPLSPWFYGARLALAAYLIVAGAIWFTALSPFEELLANDAAAQQASLRGVGTGRFDAAQSGNELENPHTVQQAAAGGNVGTQASGPVQSGAIDASDASSASGGTAQPRRSPGRTTSGQTSTQASGRVRDGALGKRKGDAL
ncbi:DotU family type IV/VI secretion system protein [Paraburkholderia solisilvae]|uniref:Type IV / VI secretion system DotU domain-containing protein n=1 Tax=Paraburkholderia solisilvae TaxID=624376 RepID=A0A6J5E582_9BURK|nr:DotU family type IV/VI secretion system protein [Paraburkholderia solisilvae]CAB3760456.1 hypothetical protein LMG29739_03396 [Paraburkholderia solisilvae]